MTSNYVTPDSILCTLQSWNDSWVESGEEDVSWFYALLGATVAAYGGALTLAGLMFHWFKPSGKGGQGSGEGEGGLKGGTLAPGVLSGLRVGKIVG